MNDLQGKYQVLLNYLKELGKEPFLHCGMKLGEGTGAVALMPLLDMALEVYRHMPDFEGIQIEAYQPL